LDGASDCDALLFPPSQQSIFTGWAIFRNRQDLAAHLRQIREAEFMCGSLRYIDYSSADVRATINDQDDRRTAVFSIFDEAIVSNGSDRCAAVKLFALVSSPLAVSSLRLE
jgi:hypothetical protein